MNDLMAKAAEIVGSQASLARAVGESPQFIWEMINKGKQVPATLCIKIRIATGGQVTEQMLRPDVFCEETLKQAS